MIIMPNLLQDHKYDCHNCLTWNIWILCDESWYHLWKGLQIQSSELETEVFIELSKK